MRDIVLIMNGHTLGWAIEPLEGTGRVCPAMMKLEGRSFGRVPGVPAGAMMETSCPNFSSWHTILAMMLLTPPGTVHEYGETTAIFNRSLP